MAVDQARDVPAVVERISAVYGMFQTELEKRKPRCDQSGRCCRFEDYGHRLFVTTLELAAFTAQTPPHTNPWDGTGCAYQVDGLCSVHATRPFGCRVYFCDPTSTDWQQNMYERFHAQIKQLHDELAVDYLYVEWREALKALGWVSVSSTPSFNDAKRVSLPVR
jgi:Fe-S-cluster containining protein